MALTLPTGRLLALGAAVVLAGTVTAWFAARAAAGRDAILAVKEDWCAAYCTNVERCPA